MNKVDHFDQCTIMQPYLTPFHYFEVDECFLPSPPEEDEVLSPDHTLHFQDPEVSTNVSPRTIIYFSTCLRIKQPSILECSWPVVTSPKEIAVIQEEEEDIYKVLSRDPELSRKRVMTR